MGMLPHGHQEDVGRTSRVRPSCHCGLSGFFCWALSKIWVRWHIGQIQSDWTDPIPGKTILSSLFTSCSGLIRCSKPGNKEEERMADFPSRDVMLVGAASSGLVLLSLFGGGLAKGGE